MAKSLPSLKLMIDTQSKRVLFAEANKDCVDFLFHILSLPVANIISLLKNQGMVGSLANLYESIENLNETYIQPNQSKDSILKPVPRSSVPLLMIKDAPPTQKKLYWCNQCPYNVSFSDDPRAVCPNCHRIMTALVPYVAPPPPPAGAEKTASSSGEGGFVKGLVTYMVMDNLVVKPMSTISSIAVLSKFNVKEVSQLEEKVVRLGMNQAVNLLKASLRSQNVLTDVFLKALGSSVICHQNAEKEPVVITKRRCVRRQSAAGYRVESTKNLFEIEYAKFPVEMEDETPRRSIGRPLRKAAEKVQSYKESPINIKMRRPE